GDPSRIQLWIDDATRQVIADTRDQRDWGRTVLILGGNGFAGAHILHRLLADRRVERVFAIGRERAGMGPRDRILAPWQRYELDPDMVELRKLVVYSGATTERRFGLAAETYARLATEVDTVLHCAGATDYIPSYLEIRQDWVIGMLGVMQFSVERRAKQ